MIAHSFLSALPQVFEGQPPLIVICALKIPVGAHAGDSGWLWIFRALFFIFLGINCAICCQRCRGFVVLFLRRYTTMKTNNFFYDPNRTGAQAFDCRICRKERASRLFQFHLPKLVEGQAVYSDDS
jgi:hypothetical protein